MSRTRKLLLTNTNYRSDVVGGGQLSVQVLAEGLVAQGHEVTVASVGTSAAVETANGVHHIRLRLQNEYWPFDGLEHSPVAKLRWHLRDADNRAMASEFDEILMTVGPDLVHTNVMTGFSAAIWRQAAGRGVPVVHTLRDYHAVCSRSSLFRRGRPCNGNCFDCRLLTIPSRRLSNDIAAVVGNSREILDTHLRLGAFTDVPIKEVVFNGYSGTRSSATKTASADGRLRLGFLGRLAPHKGIEVLLETVRGLPAAAVELVVAGAGNEPYVSGLKTRFESPNVRFLGFVEPLRLFEQIDVLVVPSLWPEPLPRTVFEAYSHGIPVIGSNRGGTPEIIEQGVTGYVFDPDEPLGLRAAIEKIGDDRSLLVDLGRAAAAKASEFLPARVVEQYLGIYSTVLDAAPVPPGGPTR